MERVNRDEKEFRGGDSGPKYLFRGPKMEWGILVFKPSQTLGAHYHNEVEETFYFEKGSPQMLVNDISHRARPGDAFRLEPKERHDIINDTQEDVQAIFIKCPYIPTDKVRE